MDAQDGADIESELSLTPFLVSDRRIVSLQKAEAALFASHPFLAFARGLDE